MRLYEQRADVFGLRQTASTLPISAAGTYAVPLREPTAETLLEADGILLDVSGGSFLGAPHSVPPISGGVLPDVFRLNALTDVWNKRDVERRDIVLDPRLRGSDPAASGRAAVRKVIGSVGGLIDSVTLDMLDSFAVGAAMLRAIATMLPRGSRVRLLCAEGSDDANFAAVASETGVAIERYKPPMSIPQHDRFLRLRERLWSVGSLLNHLGQFSVRWRSRCRAARVSDWCVNRTLTTRTSGR